MLDLAFLESIEGGGELLTTLSNINPLFISIGIILLSIIAGLIVVFILKGIKKGIADKTSVEFDEKLLELSYQPIFRLIIIAGIYLAVLNLELESSLANILLKIINTIMYIIILNFISKAFDILFHHGLTDFANKTGSNIDNEIIPLFRKTVGVVVWGFGIILILGMWGVDIGPFLAGLGIAGIAVSFALQSTLSNVFAGISIILDKTFKVGDKIQLDSGELGTIYDITLRSTRIKTYDNELIIVPNEVMAKARIKNFTQPDLKIRVFVDFSVEYGTDPKKIIDLIKKAIENKIDGALKDPPVVVEFTKMSDFSLDFSARFWVKDYSKAYNTKLEATTLIYNELNKAKIGIPFPTQTLHIKK
ncbi:MAG: mechanosensitive ion channel family protein [Candidatus Micrarchaeia archaeon]